jgi:G3E family GTPase
VLTKTDLVPDPPSVAARLRPLAPNAGLVTATHGALPPELVLGLHATGGKEATPSAHGALFASVTLRPCGPLPAPVLRAALEALPDGVLRAKGFLRLDGVPILLQRVGRRLELTPLPAPPPEEALVLIGTEDVWAAAEVLLLLGFRRT